MSLWKETCRELKSMAFVPGSVSCAAVFPGWGRRGATTGAAVVGREGEEGDEASSVSGQ